MSDKFRKALTNNDVLGENKMPAHTTSNNPVLDLLFSGGAARHWPEDKIISLFSNALGSDFNAAVVLLFHIRDIRGGMGERDFFRTCFNYLSKSHPKIAERLLPLIPEYGRWDDVFWATEDSNVLDSALRLLYQAIREGDGLAAKWAPREGKSDDKFFRRLIRIAGFTPKQYRKLVVRHTNVVENKMCANKWDKINYNHVPSQAMRIYSNAFLRHDEQRFREWLDSLKDPESENRVHAETLVPHELVRNYLDGRRARIKKVSGDVMQTTQAQWDELPIYSSAGDILVMSDLSGSMTWELNGLPFEASVGLAIYFAEHLKSSFNNLVLSFSQRPYLIELPKNGTLYDKVSTMMQHRMAQNTNLELAFKLILDRARTHNLPEEDMPKVLLILSDMQFDRCTDNPSLNAMEMIRTNYRRYGYKLPHVVFWNLRAKGHVPIKRDERGVTLLSGYSPALLSFVTEGALTPEDALNTIINSERYEPVRKVLL